MHNTIVITFISEYHISSGLGDGHWADSMLIRDNNGLPYLPGRAVKGALREAAWRLGQCRQDLQVMEFLLWGTRSTSRETNKQGCLRVGQGNLPAHLQAQLLALDADLRDTVVRDMTIRRIQTALDGNGQVVTSSLRTLECGIPGLSFIASLEIPDSTIPDCISEAWLGEYLRAVCAAVKSMGGSRSRGLGMCRVALLPDTPHSPVSLPAPLDMEQLTEIAADYDFERSTGDKS